MNRMTHQPLPRSIKPDMPYAKFVYVLAYHLRRKQGQHSQSLNGEYRRFYDMLKTIEEQGELEARAVRAAIDAYYMRPTTGDAT